MEWSLCLGSCSVSVLTCGETSDWSSVSHGWKTNPRLSAKEDLKEKCHFFYIVLMTVWIE